MSRTYVLACSVLHAEHWCRLNGVQPFSRSTVLASHPDRLRGHTIRSSDRVVILDPSDELIAELDICRFAGEVVE